MTEEKHLRGLSSDQLAGLESTVERFESQWQLGSRPSIESYVGEADNPTALLVELVRVELENRLKLGEVARVEEYLHRFPSLVDQPHAVVDIIVDEYEFRRRRNAQLRLDDYCERFPEHSDRLVSRLQPETAGLAEDTADSHDTPPAEQPTQISRYRIERLLGAGGFGSVYLGYDDQLQRQVAIKVPHRKLFRGIEDAKPYLDEARALAKLDHPQIVPVYDVGSTSDVPCFIVSKYIDGVSLDERVRQAPVTHEEAVKLVAAVAEAVHHAHLNGLVHRDIKPANILIDAAGRPHVVDFGVALHQQAQSQGPSYAGTLPYMSPEQARADGDLVDGRSDVFSLGVVLHELIAGKLPFIGETSADTIHLITSMDPTPLRYIDNTVSEGLEAVCLKALSKQPADRYTTAQDFARALRRCIGTAQPSRRKAALLVTTSVILILLGWIFWPRPTAPPDSGGDGDNSQPAGSLSADFGFRVWSETKHGIPIDNPRALPLVSDDRVRFDIEVSEPAHVYIFWIDAEGQPAEVFPIDPDLGDRGDQPRRSVRSPKQIDRGWEVTGRGGMETAVVLIRRSASPQRDNLSELLKMPPAHRFNTPGEAIWYALDEDVANPRVTGSRQRGLGNKSAEIDDPILQLLSRLRSHFDLVKAVRVAHVENE